MKRARGGPMGAEYTTECWSSAAQYVHDRSLASGLAAARVESWYGPMYGTFRVRAMSGLGSVTFDSGRIQATADECILDSAP